MANKTKNDTDIISRIFINLNMMFKKSERKDKFVEKILDEIKFEI